MSLTKFENDCLLDAKQKFEKEISSVLVDIDKSNKSLIVTFKNNDINLIKTYSLKNWDDNYQTWIDNFKVHLLAESNKKINVVDIPNEHRSFYQKCASCYKPNPYGDLLCSKCYEQIDQHYEKEQQKYQAHKIKR